MTCLMINHLFYLHQLALGNKGMLIILH